MAEKPSPPSSKLLSIYTLDSKEAAVVRENKSTFTIEETITQTPSNTDFPSENVRVDNNATVSLRKDKTTFANNETEPDQGTSMLAQSQILLVAKRGILIPDLREEASSRKDKTTSTKEEKTTQIPSDIILPSLNIDVDTILAISHTSLVTQDIEEPNNTITSQEQVRKKPSVEEYTSLGSEQKVFLKLRKVIPMPKRRTIYITREQPKTIGKNKIPIGRKSQFIRNNKRATDKKQTHIGLAAKRNPQVAGRERVLPKGNQNINMPRNWGQRPGSGNRRGRPRYGNVRYKSKKHKVTGILNLLTAIQSKRYSNRFFFCIPLNVGSMVLAIGGIIYGFIGVFFSFSMAINLKHWKAMYVNRLDVLLYLFIVFVALFVVFIVSIILMCGVILREEWLFSVYSYGVLSHLGIIWTVTLSMFFYCLGESMCFQGDGVGFIVVAAICGVFYSMFWVYLVQCMNCYIEQIKYY